MNKKENIRIIKKEDKEYPGLLKAISDPPKVLYCIGDVKLLSGRALGVVGSRKCSEYGRTTAMRIGETAARNDVTVVSGMAKGIDRFAHLGALGAGGKTIAVLGCGVNICYPKENRTLYEQIASEGLLISELPPDTEPMPYAFPRRNRIISGIGCSRSRNRKRCAYYRRNSRITGKRCFCCSGEHKQSIQFGDQ